MWSAKTVNMKKVLLLLSVVALTGCRGCFSDYSQRKAGVNKVCPTCTYVVSEGMHIAVDTATQPNTIYRVTFCNGAIYYNSWDVDHLTKIE